MTVVQHLAAIDNETDRALASKLILANTVAVDKNNQAGRISREGWYDEASHLYKEALELKVSAYGLMSVQAAITLNAMGENYLRAKELRLAETSLRSALQIRDDRAFGGLELGPRCDAAVTRDNLGQLFEEQGLFPEARDIRRKGAPKGETMCGNINCPIPGGAMLGTNELQACGACHSVFYCGMQCQKMDWRARHKVLCQTFCAKRNGTSAE
ncbi:hypothetical protein GQ53DRAFT_803267 [Thozetella sp. PMI_491]|nr:hypothetical protein GQ53DRAFT_803267 [Thozetella sp. PMI_491]